MPLSQARFTDISAHAYTHWLNFISSQSAFRQDDIFAHRTKINAAALSLFQYCVEQTLGIEGASIFPCDLSSPPRGARSWQGRAVSWLYHAGGNVPVILIDLDYISSTIFSQNVRRASTRVVLHEIGHLVLHWSSLAPMPHAHTPAATPAHEEEAWCFATAIIGLALGDLSKSVRDQSPPYHCTAWPLA